MQMKILIIGPFPPPVDGCSNSNKVLYRNIVSRNIKCATIDTNTDVISGNQGSKFSLEKALKFMGNYEFRQMYAKTFKTFRCLFSNTKNSFAIDAD